MNRSTPGFPVLTISWGLLTLVSIESVIPSNHLILCHPLLLLPSIFPIIRVFSSQFFASGGQSMGASGSASVFPVNIQGWFPLGFTAWTSLPSKGFSIVFSSTTIRKHWFFGVQPSLWRGEWQTASVFLLQEPQNSIKKPNTSGTTSFLSAISRNSTQNGELLV